MVEAKPFPMVREVPYMGVIWVVYQASLRGFVNGDPDWCNLGQGQPEVGEMAGDMPRINHIDLEPGDHAYGPVGGTLEVREAIADMINREYRQGKMPYGPENISFASGGRLALTRLYTILADGCRIAYKNPDYTAYEDYLYGLRNRCMLLPIYAKAEDAFKIPAEKLAEIIHQERINCCPANRPVSALEFVDDVNKDPVVCFDGLTKSYRYPGWRAGWAVGPADIIEQINRAASAVDGGPSMLTQRATLEAIKPERVAATTKALRENFAKKRAVMLSALKEMGIRTAQDPSGTFYVWACIEDLPEPINDADKFFFACLEKKVMTVPGHFFDVRPHRVRPAVEPYRHWVRLSYGPNMETLVKGLTRMKEVVDSYRK